MEIDFVQLALGNATPYVSGAKIPKGKYNKVRVTKSCTMKLKGSITFGGMTYYTIDAKPGTKSIAGSPGTDFDTRTLTLPDAAGCSNGLLVTDFDVNFEFKGNTSKKCTMKLNVSDALALREFPGGVRLLGPAPVIPTQTCE